MAPLDREGKEAARTRDHIGTDSAVTTDTFRDRPGQQPHNAGITPGWAKNAAGEYVRVDRGDPAAARRTRLRRILVEAAEIAIDMLLEQLEVAGDGRGGAA